MSFAKQRITGFTLPDTGVRWWFMRHDEEVVLVRVRAGGPREDTQWIVEGAFRAGEPDFAIPLPPDVHAGDLVCVSLADPKEVGCFLEPAAPSQEALIFGRVRLRPPPPGIPRFPTKTVPG